MDSSRWIFQLSVAAELGPGQLFRLPDYLVRPEYRTLSADALVSAVPRAVHPDAAAQAYTETATHAVFHGEQAGMTVLAGECCRGSDHAPGPAHRARKVVVLLRVGAGCGGPVYCARCPD